MIFRAKRMLLLALMACFCLCCLYGQSGSTYQRTRLSINRLRAKHPRAGGIVSGITHIMLGLFFGAAGCILTFGLFFMNNDYIQQNINILFVNPLLLVMVPLGVLEAAYKFNRIQPERRLKTAWTYVFAAGMIRKRGSYPGACPCCKIV
jgi:hypothetical protein